MTRDDSRPIIGTHHILIDGWSLQVLLDDLVMLYWDDRPLAHAPPYRAYFERLAAPIVWLGSRRGRRHSQASTRAATWGWCTGRPGTAQSSTSWCGSMNPSPRSSTCRSRDRTDPEYPRPGGLGASPKPSDESRRCRVRYHRCRPAALRRLAPPFPPQAPLIGHIRCQRRLKTDSL
jgi:hypothetical protein